MGIATLFDKSFLQSLSENEAVWFDHYLLGVICPIFYVETLADLAKTGLSENRSAEGEVRIIATKTPSRQSTFCLLHHTLALTNLLGRPVPMNGQIPVPGARMVKTERGISAYYEDTDEVRAFSRWQAENFREVERSFASRWRSQLSELDLKALAIPFAKMGLTPQSVKSLAEAKSVADTLIDHISDHVLFMQLIFQFFGFPNSAFQDVMRRWDIYRFRPLRHHAPYLAHILTVEIFFRVAIASNLISSERKSNRTDIAYLFYLPFCHIFVSTDKLHRQCVPHFLRPDQQFVWGGDLKRELSRINEHFSSLPEEERRLGLFAVAPSPVGNADDLMIQIYDRHTPGWRERSSSGIRHPQESELGRKLHQEAETMKNAPTISDADLPEDPNDLHSVVMSRSIKARRGDWWIIPASIAEEENRKRRSDGEKND